MPESFVPEHELLVEVQVMEYVVRLWIAMPTAMSRAMIFHRGTQLVEVVRMAAAKAESTGESLDEVIRTRLQQEEVPLNAIQLSRDFGDMSIGQVTYLVPFTSAGGKAPPE